MKRSILITLSLVALLNTGCITARTDGRPGFFRSIYNRLHPSNIGSPCRSGLCNASAPVVPMVQQPIYPPAMAPAYAMESECADCGPGQTLGYPSYEGYSEPSFNGSVYDGQVIYEGGNYSGGLETVTPAN